MKFKLIAATHVAWEHDKNGEDIWFDTGNKDADGKPIKVRREKTYVAGDIVYSKSDLTLKFVNKFQRVYDENDREDAATQAALPLPQNTFSRNSMKVIPELDKMSTKELLSYAEGEEIDLKGVNTGKSYPLDYTYRFRQWEEFEMRPGREYTGPGQDYLKWRSRERYRGDLPTMDFNVSFWHDGLSRFVDPPDYTMIALAPMPKAIKVSLTIWDFEGRAFETFSRIMWLPCGVGGTQLVNGVSQNSKGPGHFRGPDAAVVDQGWAPDPTGYTYNTSDDDWAIATTNTERSGYFNRYKQIVGDVSTDYGGGTNWNLINKWDLMEPAWGAREPSEW